MSFSLARSNTPSSDYTSPRSDRALAAVDDTRVIEVYLLKDTADPVLVLVPVARVETYSVLPLRKVPWLCGLIWCRSFGVLSKMIYTPGGASILGAILGFRRWYFCWIRS